MRRIKKKREKLPDCKGCEYSIFYEGFELDPICSIASGILCKDKKTSNFKTRTSKIVLKKGSVFEMLEEALANEGQCHVLKQEEVSDH